MAMKKAAKMVEKWVVPMVDLKGLRMAETKVDSWEGMSVDTTVHLSVALKAELRDALTVDETAGTKVEK